MGCCFVHESATIGRAAECPRCGRIYSSTTTLYQFNQHLDNCLIQSQHNKILPYKGIMYWEKIKNGQTYTWVQKEYNPHMAIDEKNIQNEEFGQKQVWFRIKLEKLRIPWQNGCTYLQISQKNLIQTSVEETISKKKAMHGEVKIHFVEDEIVQDAGGLLREWSTSVIAEMIKEGYLKKNNSLELNYRIASLLEFKSELYYFLGILVGKCIFERITISSYFDRTIIRQILGQNVLLDDIQSYDYELYLSWSYLLDSSNNDFDTLEIFFVLEHNGKQYPLKENGEQIKVTQDNLKEFINLCLQFYTKKLIQEQINEFLHGLYYIIPRPLLMIFKPEELEMIMFGLPFIDMQDWKRNTIYKGCNESDEQVLWFWSLLESWSQEKLSQFLRFCTGSPRVPVEGFSKLESNRGESALFCVQASQYNKEEPYPKAHTCFNRLELPRYENEEQLIIYLSATLNEQLDCQFGLE